MAGRIPEAALVLPALQCIYDAGGEIETAELITRLQDIFDPDGEDMDVLEGRSDTKFSQKVRNLKSHKKLEGAGLAVPIQDGFKITEKGREVVEGFRSSS